MMAYISEQPFFQVQTLLLPRYKSSA